MCIRDSWEAQLKDIQDTIVFVDEGSTFVSSLDLDVYKRQGSGFPRPAMSQMSLVFI